MGMTAVMSIYQKCRSAFIFITTSIGMRLISGKRKPCIFMLNIPEHGNMGDEAIVLAEEEFFRYFFRGVKYVKVSDRQWKLCKRYVRNAVQKNDLVCLHGGGYIGDLWPGVEETARDMLSAFKENRQVMMPNTIYYYDACSAKSSLRFYDRENLLFFLRDKMSYDRARESGLKKAFLFPDSVAFMEESHVWQKRKKEVLVCLRHDKEKTVLDDELDIIFRAVSKAGLEYRITDTMAKHGVRRWNIHYKVQRKLSEFRKASLVVTDRLHGMYFSAITGTPCIALNNVSRKVEEGSKWLRHLPYIRFASEVNSELFDDMVRQMAAMSRYKYCYRREALKKHYIREARMIKKWWVKRGFPR